VKAFILHSYGSADNVRFGDRPDPTLREDDVMIQIHAAGVNPVDARIREGDFKAFLRYRLPIVLGCDVAGVVVSVGSRVRRFKPGDEVYARPADDRIGAFAELIAIREDEVAMKPKSLTMEEAASIPLVGVTAWQALVERANLQRGQKVLIHAGSGGVGTLAIQLAKHIGATVASTTSTANVALVKSLGADVVIDYRKQDFAETLRDYDVVLNSLDKRILEKSLRVLKPGGQLISISGPPDAALLAPVRRLAAQCPAGRVVATDVDMSFLELIRLPNLELVKQDVERGDFPPESFDLIHARALFMHLGERDTLLGRVASWLKPGGWLAVSEADMFPVDSTPYPAMKKMWTAAERLFTSQGSDPRWARRLPVVLGRAGLVDIGMSVTVDVVGGGGVTDEFWRSSFAQAKPFLLQQGLVDESVYAEAHALVDDPDFRDTLWAYIRAWGRRPRD